MVKLKSYILLLLPLVGWSQQTLTLDSCINQAYRNFEFTKQVDYSNNVTAANIKGIKKNYLPTLDLNASATYQNENISIPVAFPGVEPPAVPLNFNNALFSLRQWIYDGSLTSNQRAIEEASGLVKLQEIGVQRLQTKEIVMQFYFAILMQDKQLEILQLRDSILQKQLSEVEAAVESHVLLASDANLLKAEIVQLKQSMIEVVFSKRASIQGLGELVGLPLDEKAVFIEPSSDVVAVYDLNLRPDIILYDYQIDVLEAQKSLTKSNYLPKIGVFADGGVGWPGYDIFKDELAPMAKVGITLNWHILDWSKGNLQRQTLDLNQSMMRLAQERAKKQVRIEAANERNQIEKAQELMQDDEEILMLYADVTAAFAAQLENGTITSAEFIQQLNKEQIARTNLELHKLQLIIATLNYNTIVEGY